MKKIERSGLFMKENLHLFQCPVCKQNFTDVVGTSVVCVENHQFDLSKKGTLHLLLKGGQNMIKKCCRAEKNWQRLAFFSQCWTS